MLAQDSRPCRYGGHTQAAVISRIFACRTSAIKIYLTDATDVVVGDVPSPCSHSIPSLELDLHSACAVGSGEAILCLYVSSVVVHN
jgi:hypothetical protein